MGAMIWLRHGESAFNAAQIFTGLLDPPMTEAGFAQVDEAASLIIEVDLHPDLVVTSPMLRSTQTLDRLRETIDLDGVETITSWRLAERDYGSLTGVSKAVAREQLGEEAFFRLRRTMHGRPPAATAEQRASWVDPAPAEAGPLVAGDGESLADVIERVTPLWVDLLQPMAAAGHIVLVVGHGNTLRALAAALGIVTDAEIEALNIPAGHPLVIDVASTGEARMGHYLDAGAARIAAEAVAAEGGT